MSQAAYPFLHLTLVLSHETKEASVGDDIKGCRAVLLVGAHIENLADLDRSLRLRALCRPTVNIQRDQPTCSNEMVVAVVWHIPWVHDST